MNDKINIEDNEEKKNDVKYDCPNSNNDNRNNEKKNHHKSTCADETNHKGPSNEAEIESDCNCKHEKHNDCKCKKVDKENNYLDDLLRLQAEFDNYRKRMQSSIMDARNDGFIDAIEGFLPAIDSFKMATDMITDKNTLIGIKYIEKGILDTLFKMGVEEIDASSDFNPELHQAVDVDKTADVDNGKIVKVVAKGFTYKGKVIRYAQVVVKG